MDDRRPSAFRLLVVPLALIILLSLFLSSCTDGDDRLGGMPAAPDEARELTEAEIPFDPDAVAEGFKASLDAATVQIRVYSVSADIAFARLAAHYESVLPDSWVEQPSEALETARASGRDAVIWTSDATREILSLQYIAAPDLDGNVLVVIYAQRR